MIQSFWWRDRAVGIGHLDQQRKGSDGSQLELNEMNGRAVLKKLLISYNPNNPPALEKLYGYKTGCRCDQSRWFRNTEQFEERSQGFCLQEPSNGWRRACGWGGVDIGEEKVERPTGELP